MGALLVVGPDPAAARSVAEGLIGAGRPVLLASAPPGGDALTIEVEPRDGEALAAAAGRAAADLGPISMAVSLPAAVPERPIDELDDDLWRSTVDGNLTAAMHVARAVAPSMILGRGGSLAFVTWRPRPGVGQAHVAAVTGAVAMLARALAVELGGHGVRANAVTVPPPQVSAAIPLLRLLSSPAAGYVTGEALEVGEACDAGHAIEATETFP